MSIPADSSSNRIFPDKPVESIAKPAISQPASTFDAYMQGTAGAKTPPATPGAPGATGPTPMDISRGSAISANEISFNSILAQAKGAQDSLGNVGKQLNDQKLKLKRSQSHLVRQKLDDANGYIRAAGSKLGAPMGEQKLPPGLTGISRFIAMVNDGQDQLYQVQKQLSDLAGKGQSLNPGEMMAVQVKMGLAQQEIEYTSTLLSKVIQSMTQVINTQL